MSRYFPTTWSIVAKKQRRAFKLSYRKFTLLFSSAILYWFCFNEMSATTCKLLSLDLRGISNFEKRETIFTWCRKQKTDFIFLQETHSKIDSEKCWWNEWGGEIIMADGSSNSRGVAILVKRMLIAQFTQKCLAPLGQFVIVKADMFWLIHAPNKDANIVSFFNNLLVTLQKNNLDEEENIIMNGDFNCPLNPCIDKKGGLLNPRKAVISTASWVLSKLPKCIHNSIVHS